jgi:glutathione S-transferase
MPHTLVTIPLSHFCEKARWSLDAAGVPFLEVGHVPVLHKLAVHRRGGRRGSVPLLQLEGGRILDDSPLIVQYADEHAPAGRKLLPADASARRAALELERQLDLHFAPHVRRFVYFHMLPEREQALTLFRVGISGAESVLVGIMYPAMRAIMRRFMRIDERGMRRSLDQVWSSFDEIGRRLFDGRPYLMGDRFGAADIAFASFAAPLVLPPEHPKVRAELSWLPRSFASEVTRFRQHPAGKFAERMYREHRA